MLFNSFRFLWLFPIIFFGYYIVCYSSKRKSNLSRLGNYTLLLISYALYCCYKPEYALILLWVTVVTYFGALVITKHNAFNKKKYIVSIFSIAALIPLLVFKYYNFIALSICNILNILSITFEMGHGNWSIPLGISFFSFQALGYLLDVYHQRINAERNWWDYMLFVSFFPQITSGPISRAEELLPQIKADRLFKYEDAVQGLKWLLWGVFMKTVIADRLGLYVDTVYGNYNHYSGITCLVASIL